MALSAVDTNVVVRLLTRDDPKQFEDLLGLPNVRVATPSRIALALEWYGHGLDFADALHLASSQQAGSLKGPPSRRPRYAAIIR